MTEEKSKVLKEIEMESQLPIDKGNRVYWSFLYYGFCVLLPWNSILNCLDFFTVAVRFRNFFLI
jgi:hypothetical protein